MKISRFALSAMIASACCAGTAFGQTNRTAPRYYPASYYSYYQDGAASQAPAPIASASDASPVSSASCNSGPACDVAAICDGKGSSCDSLGGCGCGKSSCDSGCGCGAGGGGLGLIGGGCCNLGQPWKLCSDSACGINIGGWTSVGYHSANNFGSFNNYADRVQLGQQWFFAEKVADGSNGLGLGARIDYLYGTDAPDTQSFGIANNHFDNGWDNGGAYGHAIPQLYGEVAMGDLSVKVGKFFTICGNEVVQSTGNFFYSRQFAFYNAEPFTHTGAISTYNLDADTQLYNGYVMGWDSGFEDNGDAYIGGFKKKLSDDLTLLYTTVLGRFGSANATDERGSVHNVVLTANLTDKWTYISQTDVLYTTNGAGTVQRNTYGNINYLIYKVNDCLSIGNRFEWFNFGGAGFVDNNQQQRKNDDNFNFTTGLNYRVNSNLMFRPEARWVWDRQRFGFNENNASSQTAVGGDMVFTF
ncbi:MAG: outer membrane beta-barrel protein [Pirellula sp.]